MLQIAHQQHQTLAETQFLHLHQLVVAIGKFLQESLQLGLSQLVVVVQQVLVFQINGGVLVVAADKFHPKLFLSQPEVWLRYQLAPVEQREMGPHLHSDQSQPMVEKPHSTLPRLVV
jgi:hypothetical protein